MFLILTITISILIPIISSWWSQSLSFLYKWYITFSSKLIWLFLILVKIFWAEILKAYNYYIIPLLRWKLSWLMFRGTLIHFLLQSFLLLHKWPDVWVRLYYFCSRSFLLPIRMIIIDLLLLALTSSSHFVTWVKVSLLVIS